MDCGDFNGPDPIPDDNSRGAGGVQGSNIYSKDARGLGNLTSQREKTEREVTRREVRRESGEDQFSIRRRQQPYFEPRKRPA